MILLHLISHTVLALNGQNGLKVVGLGLKLETKIKLMSIAVVKQKCKPVMETLRGLYFQIVIS